MKEDILDTEEFFELMQQYRHARPANQDVVIEKFENVKTFIREHFVEKGNENGT